MTMHRRGNARNDAESWRTCLVEDGKDRIRIRIRIRTRNETVVAYSCGTMVAGRLRGRRTA